MSAPASTFTTPVEAFNSYAAAVGTRINTSKSKKMACLSLICNIKSFFVVVNLWRKFKCLASMLAQSRRDFVRFAFSLVMDRVYQAAFNSALPMLGVPSDERRLAVLNNDSIHRILQMRFEIKYQKRNCGVAFVLLLYQHSS